MYSIIKQLDPGKFKQITKIQPAGSLEARLLSSGAIQFYWRTKLDGKQVRVPIGLFDDRAPPKSLKPTIKGFSIPAAIRKAEEIAQAHLENKDSGGIMAVREEEKEKARTEYQVKLDAKYWTVERLFNDYCDHLERLGRKSFREAKSVLTVHAIEPWPDLVKLPAGLLTTDDITDMIRKVFEAGKGRTGNKLRSYIRAAYEVARNASRDGTIPVSFKNYKITVNPAADTMPDKSKNRADKKPLAKDDLIIYWQAIKDMPGIRGAALRLHLLTGGQRIQQLVNLKTKDITKETILIYDDKGRPGTPAREHVIPLTPQARAALTQANPQGEHALSTDGGITHISNTTLSRWAQAAVEEILPSFKAKQIRSGVETLLASHGVSKDIRGRLQSHGISGVQDKHYDGHEYLPEKRAALLRLYSILEQKSADVIQFNAA